MTPQVVPPQAAKAPKWRLANVGTYCQPPVVSVTRAPVIAVKPVESLASLKQMSAVACTTGRKADQVVGARAGKARGRGHLQGGHRGTERDGISRFLVADMGPGGLLRDDREGRRRQCGTRWCPQQ